MTEIGETAGIVGGVVTLLGVVGGGIKWLVATRDGRQRMIDETVRRQFEALELRLAEANRKITLLTVGFQKLAGELARHVPDSPALREAQKLFDLAFALPTVAPDAIVELMADLHDRTK